MTLPQSYDTYKVLFAAVRNNVKYISGVCVPPDNKARVYDGQYHLDIGFSGNTVSASLGYAITNIYAIP